jgi:5-methylthioadenosine/S-adenosylhomocysteine deaminase
VIEAMRSGTTAILEVWGGIEDYADVLVASGLRFLACEQISDRARGVRVGQPDKFEADPALAAAGLKRISDLHAKWNGAGDGRFRVGVSCHAPDMCSPEMLQSAAKLQEKLDTYATIHLNQYWGEVQATQRSFGMLPTDYVEKQGFLSDRLVAAHCRCMTPEEEEKLGKHGVTVSYNAAVAAQTGLAPNIQHLEASGCRIVLGSDEFTEDMVDVLRWAVCLERVRRGDGNSPQPEEAIRWGTANGYKAIGVSDGGVLKEGNKADLMVVGIARPHLVPFIRFVPAFVHNGQGRDVESVMVDGKWVMKDGKVLTIDEEAALRDADQVGRDLWFKVMKDNPSVAPLPGLDRREKAGL